MNKVRIGDVRLNVLDRGAGPPLLLVHGFPLDHTMWRGQIEYFADERRVIAPDLRGFGHSDATEGQASMELLADDLARLLDSLDVREPVAFCGLSMGGYVGWQFWRRHPQRLNRLILCDTRAAADTQQAAGDRRQTADRVLAEGVALVADAMLPKLFAESAWQRQPEMVAAVRQVMLSASPVGVAASLRGMAEREDVRPWLGEINLPTLLVCGRHDVISPVKEMKALASAIPQARFVEIAEAGHMAPLENPPPVNAAIHEFLRI